MLKLKRRNHKEFWKLINKEFVHSSSTSVTIVFTKFIDHFRELNAGSLSPAATFVSNVARHLQNVWRKGEKYPVLNYCDSIIDVVNDNDYPGVTTN